MGFNICSFFFMFFVFIFSFHPAIAANTRFSINGASFVSQSVPGSMIPGQTYSVSVTMRNTGTSTWTNNGGYKLGSQNPQDNTQWIGNARALLSPNDHIAPGQSKTFTFTVASPPKAGSYNFQWQMVQERVEWFGDKSSVVGVSVKPPNATFVSQSVPGSMVAGQTYSVSVTMRNNGGMTWTRNGGYKLGSQDPQDNTQWLGNASRVELSQDDNIAPGQSKTFTFTVTAPSQAGSYNFQWQMVQENVQWFGDKSSPVGVSVKVPVNNATFVSQQVPISMVMNTSYQVQVVMQNSGTTIWNGTSGYGLGPQNPTSNTQWGLPWVALDTKDNIKPGQQKVFNFTIKAPSIPGQYNFQWQMLQQNVQWFGTLTPNISINVNCPAGTEWDNGLCKDVLYVSPKGSGNVCSKISPCALEIARSLVRQKNSLMQDDITIYFNDGVYELTQPLSFTPSDSGNNGHYIVYAAIPGTTPIVSGGKLIQNWSLHDPKKNIWQASVPPGFDTRQLYVNGVRAQRARRLIQDPSQIPASKDGLGWISQDFIGMSQWKNLKNVEMVSKVGWREFRCLVDSVSSSGEVIMQNPCWQNSNQTQGFSMSDSLNWIENAYELLNEPGQWYLDKPNNLIFYIPRPGEDLKTSKVVVGNLEQLVKGSGVIDLTGRPQFVSNIRFSGLTFAYATWLGPNTTGYSDFQSGYYLKVPPDPITGKNTNSERMLGNVSFSRSNNLEFLNDKFLHLGGAALTFDTGSQNILIQGNTFSDISGGGVMFGDNNDSLQNLPELQNKNYTIFKNYFTQTGAEYEGTAAILLTYVNNVLMQQNEIAKVPYTGISMGWGWGTNSYAGNNRIFQNFIHDTMQVLEDGGGIYTLSAQPVSYINANFIDNTGTTDACQRSSRGILANVGIYHDAGSSSFSDNQNVIKDYCGLWLLLQGSSRLDWQHNLNTYDNMLVNNYVEADRTYCNLFPGDSSSCNFNDNFIANLHVFGDSLPTDAKQIIADAGVPSDFLFVKDVHPGSLYDVSYKLKVLPSGNGFGEIFGDGGIDCGVSASVCGQTFISGTAVILKAIAANGSVFKGWTGGGCSGTGSCKVTMNAATNISASFVSNK